MAQPNSTNLNDLQVQALINHTVVRVLRTLRARLQRPNMSVHEVLTRTIEDYDE